MMTGQSARSHDTKAHTRSGLTRKFGIVTGRLADWAAELEATPARVLSAMEAVGMTPLMDTAVNNGSSKYDRPTDPELRCIAMSKRDVGRVAAELLEIEPAV